MKGGFGSQFVEVSAQSWLAPRQGGTQRGMAEERQCMVKQGRQKGASSKQAKEQ